MNLLCLESIKNAECNAYVDLNILNDDRVLRNLLSREENYVIQGSYFQCVQQDITPSMRRTVADWMLEVCDESKCDEAVFHLAINYMDRFLHLCPLQRNQLQLLGTTCLLIASKFKETRPFSAETLAFFTDDSVKVPDLLLFESLVLRKLRWDISSVTPVDFLYHIFRRLPLNLDPDIDTSITQICKHTKMFAALCARDYSFSMYSASTIAGASVTAALHGLGWTKKASFSFEQLINKLHEILSIDTDILSGCVYQIEELVSRTMDSCELAETADETMQQDNSNSSDSNSTADNLHTSEKLADPTKAGTPTDVHDIHF